MPDFLLDDVDTLLEVAASAVLVYVALVVLVRVSGKRTLAKFNAFDFVVTVAFGSMVAATILQEQVSVAAGAVGLATLILAQAAVSFGSTRWGWFQGLVKAQPRLLFYDGAFLAEGLQGERVATEEVRSAVRRSGFAAMEEVLAVVLETDGSLAVIGREEGRTPPLDALSNVDSGPAVSFSKGEGLPPAGQWDQGKKGGG